MYTKSQGRAAASEPSAERPRAKSLRHKHLKIDQRKIDFAKRYFGVASEQEAIDRALSLLMEEEHILEALAPLGGSLKRDKDPWPYL